MAKPAGLWKRGNIWQYRVWIPIHLQDYFQGNRINRSLKTSSYREALKRSKSLAYEIQSLFDQVDAEAHPQGFSYKSIHSVTPHIHRAVDSSQRASDGYKTVTKSVTNSVAKTVTKTVANEPTDLPEPVTLKNIFKMYMDDPKHDRSDKTNIAYQST